MKRLLPILALVAAAFAVFSLLRNQPHLEKTDPPTSPPVADFPKTVAGVGLVEANSENIAIGTPLAGVVEKIFVKVGQTLKTGDPLFQLDLRHFEADLAVRQAALVAANARVINARTTLDDSTDQMQRYERLAAGNAASKDELMRREFAVKFAEAKLGEAEAEVVTAEAQVHSAQVDIERSTVRAPVDGTVLQLNIRPGQFAAVGQTTEPLVIFGSLHPLHLRVDVDEHDAWRVRPEAPAVAHVRGNPELKVPLKFVRFEPLVVPKRSLTGDSTERVDTRVLQVIYLVEDSKVSLFVGQQMDVFIRQEGAENSKILNSAKSR